MTLEQRVKKLKDADGIATIVEDSQAMGANELHALKGKVRKAKRALTQAEKAYGENYSISAIVNAQQEYEQLKDFYALCAARFDADFEGFEGEEL